MMRSAMQGWTWALCDLGVQSTGDEDGRSSAGRRRCMRTTARARPPLPSQPAPPTLTGLVAVGAQDFFTTAPPEPQQLPPSPDVY